MTKKFESDVDFLADVYLNKDPLQGLHAIPKQYSDDSKFAKSGGTIDGSITAAQVLLKEHEIWGQTGDAVDPATYPVLVNPSAAGTTNALTLPGVAGNYASLPDVNLLDADTAHLEQSVGQWQQNTGGAVAIVSDTSAPFGVSAAENTPTSATTFLKTDASASASPAASPGTEYSYSVQVRVGSPKSGRGIRAQLNWRDSGDVSLGNDTSSAVTAVDGEYVTVTLTATAPASTAYVRLFILNEGAAFDGTETLRLGAACLREGSDATFLPSTRIKGNVDLRAHLAPQEWASGATQAVVAKWVGTGDKRSYALALNSVGRPALLYTTGGVTAVEAIASTATSFVDGGEGRIRATRDSASGDVTFYTSTDGSSWTQLGATQSTTPSSMHIDNVDVQFGAINNGVTWPLHGALYAAEVRDGIDGPVVASLSVDNLEAGNDNLLLGDDGTLTAGAGSWVGRNATVSTIKGQGLRIIGSGATTDTGAQLLDVDITAEQEYSFSVNVQDVEGSPTNLVLRAICRDSGAASTGSFDSSAYVSDGRLEVTFTAPATTVTVDLQVRFNKINVEATASLPTLREGSDASQVYPNGSGVTDEGHTVATYRTGDATAEVVDRPCWQFTAAEWLEITDRDALDFGTGDFTVAAGVSRRNDETGTFERIVSREDASFDGWYLGLQSNAVNHFYFRIDDGTDLNAAGSPNGPKHGASFASVIATRDGGDVVLTDGSSTATSTNALVDSVDLGTDLVIGALSFDKSNKFSGLISWVAVWDRALTAAERAQIAAWDGSLKAEPYWIRRDAVFYINAADNYVGGAHANAEVPNLSTVRIGSATKDPFAIFDSSGNVKFSIDSAGVVTLAGDPTSSLEPATKQYVDTQISGGTGDAGTLDGLDSTQFIRSDVDDTKTGDLFFADSDAAIIFNGENPGSEKGIQFKDAGGTQRWGIAYSDDRLYIRNRAANGDVTITANTATSGLGGEVEVARFFDTLVQFYKNTEVENASFSVQDSTHGDTWFNYQAGGENYITHGAGEFTEFRSYNGTVYTTKAELDDNKWTSYVPMESPVGNATAPGIAVGASNTGLYLSGSDLKVTVAGSQKAYFSSSSQFNLIGAGSAAAPAITIGNDTTTGWYEPTAGAIGLSTSGVLRVTIDGTDVTSTVPVVLPSDPTTNLQAATKQYVDNLVAGGTGDAGTLDGLNSTEFLRSNANDQITNNAIITFTAGTQLDADSADAVFVPYPTADTHALSRQSGDDRYTRKYVKEVFVTGTTDTAGDYWDLWNISQSEPHTAFVATMVGYGSGIGFTRTYLLETSYNDDIHGAVDTWRKITPLSSNERPGSPPEVELIMKGNGGTSNLRMVVTDASGTANYWVETTLTPLNDRANSATIASQSGTGSMTVPTDTIPLSLAGTGGEVQVSGSRVLTVADEGSGNGIDSDTVDGLEASQFLRSDTSDAMAGDLTIEGPSQNDPTLIIHDVANGANARAKIRQRGSSFQMVTDSDQRFFQAVTNGTGGDIQFLTDSETVRMFIESGTGNVGIGTDTPGAKLHINDDAATGNGLLVTGGGGGGPLAQFTRDVGGDGTITISSSGADPQISFASASNTFAIGTDSTSFKISDNTAIGTNDRLTIDSVGNVTIANDLFISNSWTLDATNNGLSGLHATTSGVNFTVKAGNAAAVPFMVQGTTSQSANLQQWRDSTGTVLSSVSSSGFFTLVADPTANLHAATKQYVDNLVAGGTGDAGTLDGLDSTQFLRSDVADTAAGQITFQDTVRIEQDGTTDYGATGTLDWQVQLYDVASVTNTNTADSNNFSGIYFRTNGSSGNASGRMVLTNRSGGDSDFHWLLRDSSHTSFTEEKMKLSSDTGLHVGNVRIDGNTIYSEDTNGNINLNPNGTGAVVIANDLIVQGTTTTVNSNEVNIGDAIILLNSDETGTPSQDAGIEIERGTSTNAFLIFDETNNYWVLDNGDAVQRRLLTTSDEGTLDAGTLDSLDSTSFLRSNAADTATGQIDFTGAAVFTRAPTNTLTVWEETTGSNRVTARFASGGGRLYFVPGPGGTDDFSKEFSYNFGTARWEFDTSPYVGSNRVLDESDLTDLNDADTLDGLDSTQFLRSDVTDTATAGLIISGDATGTGETSASHLYLDGEAPQIGLSDDNSGARAWLHLNNDTFYILQNDGAGGTNWVAPHPLALNVTARSWDIYGGDWVLDDDANTITHGVATTFNSTATFASTATFNSGATFNGRTVVETGLITGSSSLPYVRLAAATFRATPTVTGALVINTGRAFSSDMATYRLHGYLYEANLANDLGNFLDVTIGGYDYSASSTFMHDSWISHGSRDPGQGVSNAVRWAKETSSGNFVLIIGDTTSSWDYPQLTLDIMHGYTGGVSSFDNVSISLETSLAAYESITTVSTDTVYQTVSDSENLDGLDSTQFLRSDVDDFVDGRLTVRRTGTLGDSSTYPRLEWEDSAASTQGMQIMLNVYDGELPEAGYGLVVGPRAGGQAATSMLIVEGPIYADSTDRVLTTADEGTGNGLDADTVDGDHAADLKARANHTGTQTLATISNAGTLAGKNTVGTADVDNDAITYAKMQNVSATDRLLGRDTAGAGDVEELTPAAVRTMLNVEDGATADQSAAEIKTAYESNANTNAFTDADHSKLDGIEASADVTDATNVAAAGAVMESDTSTALMSFVLDEDTMTSNSATKLATQQSIKAYVDSQTAGGSAEAIQTFTYAGEVAVSTGKARFMFPAAGTVTGLSASVNTAPTGAALNISLKRNGTQIQTESIAAAANDSGAETTFSQAMSAGDYLTVDITQVGSTVAGSDLTVMVRYEP